MSSINQSLLISGEALVVTDLNTNALQKGRIVFVDKTNLGRVIAGMRIFGSPQSRLVIDAYNSANGLGFRTDISQGSSNEGGGGKPYAFEILSAAATSSVPLFIREANTFQGGAEMGAKLFDVLRYGTSNVPSVDIPSTRYLGHFGQSVLKPNELVQIGIGGSEFNPHTVYGYNNTAKEGFIGMTSASYNEPIYAIQYKDTGNVNMPHTLTVDTISATNYLNLPALPPAQLLPITLDPVNERVGIKNPAPAYTLDVNGDTNITGNLTVGGQTQLHNSLNIVSSAVIELGYDVPGKEPTAGKIFYNGLSNQVDIVGGGYTAGYREVKISDNLTVAGTISAYSYLNLPPVPASDFLPITLDKTNNRVGINRTNPTHDLDVAGTGRFNGLMVDNQGILEFGHGIAGKDPYAGQINYVLGTGQLLITGAGAGYPDRVVRIKDKLHVDISITTEDATLTGSLTTSQINFNNNGFMEVAGGNLVITGPGAGWPDRKVTIQDQLSVNKLITTPDFIVSNIVGAGTAFPDRVINMYDKVNISFSLATPVINNTKVGSSGNGNLYLGSDAASQGVQAIAIGTNAGLTGQQDLSIAIGADTGSTNQDYQSVAIGFEAGKTDQGNRAVAIGFQTGKTTQGNSTVAIGVNAGNNQQGDGSVAIGIQAGNNAQGLYAVAIGTNAGKESQHANSIVLNATGSDLNTTQINSFYVKPIRNNKGPQVLSYDTTSGEITQSTFPQPTLLEVGTETTPVSTTVATICSRVLQPGYYILTAKILYSGASAPPLTFGSAVSRLAGPTLAFDTRDWTLGSTVACSVNLNSVLYLTEADTVHISVLTYGGTATANASLQALKLA